MNASRFLDYNNSAIEKMSGIGFMDAYTFGSDFFQLITVLSSETDPKDDQGGTHDVTLNFFAGDTSDTDETLTYRLTIDHIINEVGVEKRATLDITPETSSNQMMEWFKKESIGFSTLIKSMNNHKEESDKIFLKIASFLQSISRFSL
jgi:hypothetical protein